MKRIAFWIVLGYLIAFALTLALAFDTYAQSGGGVRAAGTGTNQSVGTNEWHPAKIGGGGYITGIDITADGTTFVARTDTYGAYLWDAGANEWRQIVTVDSMPNDPTYIAPGTGGGIYELVASDSLPSRLYMGEFGRIFRSNDTGTTWTVTAFTPVSDDESFGSDSMFANGATKRDSQKIAVDPSDPNHVLVGTKLDGLWRTLDGGASWSQVATVPTTSQISAIKFAPSSVVWLGSAGSGIYRSSNNGSSFSLVTGGATDLATSDNAHCTGVQQGPGGAFEACCAGAAPNPANSCNHYWHGAVEGSTYFVSGGKFGSARIWRHDGAWTNCNFGSSDMQNFALDPFSNRMVAANESTSLRINNDSTSATCGSTWQTDFFFNPPTRDCTGDVGWLCPAATPASNGLGFIQSTMEYDPLVSGRVWIATGIGVWRIALPTTAPTPVPFTSQSRGIEQLVGYNIIVPPGGSAIAGSSDFGVHVLTNPNVYPSTWIPGDRFGAAKGLDYASSDPSFLVALVCDYGDGYANPHDMPIFVTSTNGGTSWNGIDADGATSAMPLSSTACASTWGRGGILAASSSTNWVVISSDRRRVYYTLNGGSSWSIASIPDIPDDTTDAGWGGFHPNQNYHRQIVTADRVTANVFYASHYLEGILRSTDGGANWTVMNGPLLNDSAFNDGGFNAKLKAVPGNAGHLFYTSGQQGSDPAVGNPAPNPLWRSTDGGDTWTKVPNVYEVYAFGFGKTVAGYPTILVAGWVSGSWGIWRSIDNAVSWQRIGTDPYPLNSFDGVVTLDGDKVIDRVYVGFGGQGYAYYDY